MPPPEASRRSVPCPAHLDLLRARIRSVLAERRKWTAMPQLLDEVDACRRQLSKTGAAHARLR